MTDKASHPGGGKREFTSLFSLTGYLNLYQKGFFKGQYRRFWFWFDEQTCSLKYYKTQDTYLLSIHGPVGAIDLRYAKVTPGIAGGASSNKSFHINVSGQIYILSADDANCALNWIQKLQEKRSEYIRLSSAREENALKQERGKRTLVLDQKPVGMLGSNPATPDEEHSPSTVRKIMSAHIPLMGRHSVTLDTHLSTPTGTSSLDPRRSTVATSIGSESKPLQKSASANNIIAPSATRSQSLTQSTPLEEVEEVAIPSFPLTPDEREKMQLAHSYFQSQEKVAELQKEMVRLEDQLASRDLQIVKLKQELSQLSTNLARVKTPHCDLILENDSLKDILEQYRRSLKTLDGEIEVHKLNQTEHVKRIGIEKQRVYDFDRELRSIKAKYVRLLSENFKILVSNLAGPQEDEDYPQDDKYTDELLNLVKQEGGENSAFDSYNSKFEDQYGDLHDWQSGTSTQHYLCRQLYLHYTQQEQDKLLEQWIDYLSQVKKTRSKPYPDVLPTNDRTKKRELRNLIRKGVPIQYRTQLWTSLIYRQVGRLKEVRDAAAGRDKTYYQSLLSSQTISECEKQIQLDLYRTLPNNRHFKQGGDGAIKLRNVLVAFSLHNANVGYCQGMNMLAAIALLFLDEETAFWFMITLIEKLLPPNYFTPGLLGAQADQAVVRELVANQLPLLHTHLQNNSIDVTLVTFNWFLTLFVDALPTESVLHILDCYLMEGHKILFRVSLGILKINERRILSKTDPVTLFQLLKEIARHSFDVEQLLNISFNEFVTFPSRSNLSSRHQHHLAIVREQWLVREKERAIHVKSMKEKKFKKQQTQLGLLASSIAVRDQQPSRQHLVWECGCVRREGGEGGEEVWLCCGERQQGRIGIISVKDSVKMEIPNTDVGSRVICVQHVPNPDIILLGTLDFILHAIDCKTRKEVWSVKLNDSVLDIMVGEDCNVYAALADGFIAVLQNVCSKVPDSDPILLRIGSTSVPCLALAPNQQLWCGCGKAITVVAAGIFEPVQSLVVDEIAGKVYKMETGKRGIWVSFRSSSIVCLFDTVFYVKLMQVDYTMLLPEDSMTVTEKTKPDHRITSMMEHDGHLWLGTGNGNVHIFSTAANVSNPILKIRQLAKQSMQSRQESEHGEQKGTGLIGEVSTEESFEGSCEISSGGDSPIDVRTKTRRENFYEQRRKTTFGRTIRRQMHRESSAYDKPSLFKLIYQNSRELLNSKNESVRVLLSLRSQQSDVNYAVSCVHSLSEWQKGIQVWQCPTHSSPSQWLFEYLPPPEQGSVSTPDPARKRTATTQSTAQLQTLLEERSTELLDSNSTNSSL